LNSAQWKAVNTVIKLQIPLKEGSGMAVLLKENPIHVNLLVIHCITAEPMILI
jgi:hypothetical protein